MKCFECNQLGDKSSKYPLRKTINLVEVKEQQEEYEEGVDVAARDVGERF